MAEYIHRLFDIIYFAEGKFQNKTALAGKKNGKWITYSQKEFIENANAITSSLLNMGLKKGELVVNISDNRPEWNFLDMGLLQAGGVHVPVFPTISRDELKYILDEVKPRFIFLSNRFLLKKVKDTWEGSDKAYIFSFDSGGENGVYSFWEWIEEGKNNIDIKQVEKAKNDVGENDWASVIYTSGTTTMPKGVILSHKNHLTNIMVTASSIGIDHTMNILSYLPLSHSYERMVNYVCMIKGLTVYYNESMGNIISNFEYVRPGILITVPLLLERIYKGIINKKQELKGLSKYIYKLALNFALRKKDTSKQLSFFDKFQRKIYDKLVYSKWRALMGGRVRKIICGGSALSRDIYAFFNIVGIPVHEGYGVTELAPLISFNNLEFDRPGTVGQPLVNVKVKIAGDGEILAKGPNLMQGYYNHPELTSESIDENGWFHTGDLGYWQDANYLTISGRKKNIFKNASGTYVYPERIENQLKLSSFVEHALIVGEYQQYLGALIVLEQDYLKKWAKQNGIESDVEQIRQHPDLKAQIDDLIKTYNDQARDTHQIKAYKLLTDEWSIENGELTPSMKLKRNNLAQRYAREIQSFYASRAL
ncbi:MAG: long-chain fatty acid--CoA ligase [Bacteroidales bacterium]|nr:long-chain fatty acid--CoA ligase [Bacteroidales bacterium]MCF8338026.1 long-chain fatty acid--CoA ligase [Bacteroidales bacterium]